MKILVADPLPEVLTALQLSLNQLPGITLVSKAGSLVQLMAQCAQTCPNVILFDPDLAQPARSRAQALADLVRVLRRLCPASRVVVMSSRFEAEQEAQQAGADGFISKTAPPDEFLSSLARFVKDQA